MMVRTTMELWLVYDKDAGDRGPVLILPTVTRRDTGVGVPALVTPRPVVVPAGTRIEIHDMRIENEWQRR